VIWRASFSIAICYRAQSRRFSIRSAPATHTGSHEVPAVITRVAIPLLLLPLLALGLPLLFALAWIQEAISERSPQPPLDAAGWTADSFKSDIASVNR